MSYFDQLPLELLVQICTHESESLALIMDGCCHIEKLKQLYYLKGEKYGQVYEHIIERVNSNDSILSNFYMILNEKNLDELDFSEYSKYNEHSWWKYPEGIIIYKFILCYRFPDLYNKIRIFSTHGDEDVHGIILKLINSYFIKEQHINILRIARYPTEISMYKTTSIYDEQLIIFLEYFNIRIYTEDIFHSVFREKIFLWSIFTPIPEDDDSKFIFEIFCKCINEYPQLLVELQSSYRRYEYGINKENDLKVYKLVKPRDSLHVFFINDGFNIIQFDLDSIKNGEQILECIKNKDLTSLKIIQTSAFRFYWNTKFTNALVNDIYGLFLTEDMLAFLIDDGLDITDEQLTTLYNIINRYDIGRNKESDFLTENDLLNDDSEPYEF